MPEPGDFVLIKTEKEEFKGILMPRPEILEKGITVIKLDNGYNIGIEDKKIKEIKLILEYAHKKTEKNEIKQKKGLPNVTIISTGGTISSKIDYKTGGVIADYTAEDFVAMMPELADIANLKTKKIMSVMTEDFTYHDWAKIAEEAAKEVNSNADGIVITMGTDTMHIAAAALSFMLKDLSKPVIITAAQRSIDRGSSDSFMNLICAIISAAKFNAAEVMICMHGTENDDYCLLIRGTKVRKMHTSRRDAFRPINELPIAKVFPNGEIDIVNQNYKSRSSLKASASTGFEQKTALIQIYPGMEPSVIDFYVDKGYKGIVLASTALGHVPQAIYPNIERAISKNVAVVIATQTIYGRVHPYVYSALRMLSIKMKCIFAEDMLAETAYVKLGCVLAKTNNIDEVKKMMIADIAGEITERSDNSFLY